MKIIELIINELDELSGVEALSVVESPAIEANFIALKDELKFELKTIDEDKRILLGPALIPNKPIYRRDENGEEYYIYFSKDTVVKAAQLFLKRGNQNEATLEHEEKVQGLSVVESWIVEDDTHDKSRKYGLNVPVGTWMVTQKVENEEVWQLAKQGKIKGFSIEAYFADKFQASEEKPQTNWEALVEEIKKILDEDSDV